MYPSNKKKKVWRDEKERLLKMTLEERRKEYLRDYVQLKDIPSWKEEMKCKGQSDDESTEEVSQLKKSLSEKVSLYRGDITLLEIDAIVNAANASLLGGGGVDGCIHRAAGPCLVAECRNLNGCETGQAKITCGYDLPAKYVIHTVGPIARGHIGDTQREDLASCYKSSLKLVQENNIRSVAFPCISTGIYGFPNEPAANIALTTIKEWLKKNHHEMERIIFCVFLDVDYKIFKKKMSEFFPIDDDNEDDDAPMNENSEGSEQKDLSPSKRSKAEKPECSKDSSEDDNGTEEKQSPEEMEGLSQGTDEAKLSNEPRPSEEEGVVGLCKDQEDFSEDGQVIQEDEPTHYSVGEQDLAEGQESDSMKNEMKMDTDSQSSQMEIEEPFLHQEDATNVQKSHTLLDEGDKEETEDDEEGAAQESKSSGETVSVEDPRDVENAKNLDGEMKSQIECNDPTESQLEN
ncbi:ADP-ribose glycohydrolase MACROD2 isoform X2 [Tachyglossus aculeatus]|uniref:ADP-ribose glycohydrolase MACROD2 isoform X2 n=1 Tax=Tachyglossus aculeatus TaxID=9261 RepID=UPI0018F5FFB3|nr:ADP-ribose glycohydrolase MACROD2 isoform X2 [Tachyglossus aculeatus]